MRKPSIRVSNDQYAMLCQIQNELSTGGRRPLLRDLADVAIGLLRSELALVADRKERWDMLREMHLGNVTDE